MQTINLPEITSFDDKLIAQIDISELIKNGLKFAASQSELADFFYLKNDYGLRIVVMKSAPSAETIEIHYCIPLNQIRHEKVHISEEIFVTQDLDFVCPLSKEFNCTRLYLRADYPLFGSANSLNIT